MIDWANANSGFLLVILTAVYVVATIAMWRSIARSNALASKSLAQALFIERARTRPYLAISLHIEDKGGTKDHPGAPYAHIVVANHGQSQARNVEITIEPALKSKGTLGGVMTEIAPYFIEHVTPGIAPGQSLSDALGFTSSLFERYNPSVFSGLIKYEDASGSTYKESFRINLEAMKLARPLKS